MNGFNTQKQKTLHVTLQVQSLHAITAGWGRMLIAHKLLTGHISVEIPVISSGAKFTPAFIPVRTNPTAWSDLFCLIKFMS